LRRQPGDHFGSKPGNVQEFGSCREKVGIDQKSGKYRGTVCGKVLFEKSVIINFFVVGATPVFVSIMVHLWHTLHFIIILFMTATFSYAVTVHDVGILNMVRSAVKCQRNLSG